MVRRVKQKSMNGSGATDARERMQGYRDREEERSREAERAAQEAAAMERDPVLRLQAESRKHAADYMEGLRKADFFGEKVEPESAFNQMSMLHQAYSTGMVLSMISPLARGVNAQSLLGVVGMGTAMWALSPNFRNTVGHYGSQLQEGIAKAFDKRREASYDRKEAKLEEKLESFDPDNPSAWARMRTRFTGEGKQERLLAMWGDRLHNVKDERYVRSRGGSLFTTKSAALTHVGLMESAYDEMREPGADVEAIQERLDSMVSRLYAQAVEDNVFQGEGLELGGDADAQKAYVTTLIEAEQRRIIGQRMMSEPGFAAKFGELAHGAVNLDMGGARDSASGRVSSWEGGFRSIAGDEVRQGAFSLRQPLGMDSHRENFANIMLRDLADEQSVDSLNQALSAYAKGGDFHGFRERGIDLDQAAGPEDRQRMERIASFYQAMEDDGFSREEQEAIYRASMGMASSAFEAHNPRMAQAWSTKYSNWREDWASRDSGFGSDYDRYWRSQRDEFVQEKADYHRRCDEEFRRGADSYEFRSAPDGSGGFDQYWVDGDGARVAFDVTSVAWLPEDEAHANMSEYEGLREQWEAYEAAFRPQPTATGYEAGPAKGDQEHVDLGIPEEGLVDDELPKAGFAVDPAYYEGVDSPKERAALLLQRMSAHIARDVKDPSRLGTAGGGSLEEQRKQAMGAWSNSRRGLSSKAPYGAAKALNRRAESLQGMQAEMEHLGLPQMQQEAMLAAAYVQALEEVAASDSTFTQFLEDRASDAGGDIDDWREAEYLRAGENTESGFPFRNYERVSQEFDEALDQMGDPEQKEAKEARIRRARLATYRAAKLNRVHINQGTYVMSHDQTLLDRIRDGADQDQHDVNDPGQTRLG